MQMLSGDPAKEVGKPRLPMTKHTPLRVLFTDNIQKNMILFFGNTEESVIAVESSRTLSSEETGRLSWLFAGAPLIEQEAIEGRFIGPRREMITPWSTNAVEITQNMNLDGILRIEEYRHIADETTGDDGIPADFDPMLQRIYKGLDQRVFTINHQPEEIKYVENLEEYNEQEGLALSAEEIEYLHKIEEQNGRPLTDSEIFGFAQINSEHCRHKIFGGKFIIDGKEMESSLFDMIKKTTKENPNAILSAYKDNVAFAQGPMVEQFAPKNPTTSDYFETHEIESVISLKAETHNFPTTVEPFNGAATGTGGEIRDRMGGGTGSWPIAGTAVYMTAYPEDAKDKTKVRPGAMAARKWLYQSPEQILIKASNGASDFGNKFGQPLICGSVLTFEHKEDDQELGYDKVIMLAGGVGYANKRDCLKREPQKGNKIVVVGGDNYRIGLGGGSVSSVDTGRYSNGIELNAIQRANPEMQKRAYNLVRALTESDDNPIMSIHDHGSAGHLNCLSELVEDCGGKIEMDKLPIGDKTLSAKEIIANESQERMGLLIDESHIDMVKKIAERERAPFYVVGETTGDAHFAFEQADGRQPFSLDVAQMFGHSPKTIMTDETVVRHYKDAEYKTDAKSINEYLEGVLRLEAVACKDWLTNKVDRSVTGKIARQQCQGVLQLPLSDCGVVALDYRGKKGIATAIGHAPQAGLASPEAGSVLSVAEALTNIVWAPLNKGLKSVSLSANWMWPCRSQKGEDARLYNAVKALSDFCCDLKINVPTGKDSLSLTQQYPDGKKVISPGTVIVSAGGEVSDIRKVVSPVVVNDKNSSLYHIDFSFCAQRLGGSAFAQSIGYVGDDVPTVLDAEYFEACFNAIQELIRRGWIMSGHDISAGGLITTLLEMSFANTEGGMHINLHNINNGDVVKTLFAENPGVVIQVSDDHKFDLRELLEDLGVGFAKIGYTTPSDRTLTIKNDDEGYLFDIDRLRDIWYHTSFLFDQKQSFNGMAAERYRNYKHQPLEMVCPRGFNGSLLGMGARIFNLKEEKGDDAKNKNASQAIAKPKAAIIREKGTNGEREMAYSLYLAGFEVKDVMMTDLISGRETLDDVNMIVFCGGFSNSDVLGSAKGWAGAFLYNPKAKETLDRFYSREDTLSLGICNGCQLMVELGLIDKADGNTNSDGSMQTKMEHNTSHKFESAFLTLRIPKNNSVMLGSLAGSKLGIWVAHGEGRFHLPKAETEYNIVAKYNRSGYPGNPNGSDYDVAGICSADGRHIAMMPHLERAIFPWQCGWYPENRRGDEATPWMEAFVNARRWVSEKIRQK